MTDLEEDPLDSSQISALESIIQGHAMMHYKAALDSTEGPKAYFKMLIHDVVKDYKNAHFLVDNVMNFAIERWRHWARHAEKIDPADVIAETYIDTFHYLCRLKNDFDVIEKPPYRDDPFH